MMNCEVIVNDEIDEDEFIDIIEGNRKYMPCIYILNKIDSISYEELKIWGQIPHFVPISAMLEWNFDELYETIWEYLDIIRIYTKPKGESPDFTEPVIMKRNQSSLRNFC